MHRHGFLPIRRRAVLVVLLLVSLLPVATSAQPASQHCEQYTTQEEAQAEFDADPVTFRDLDDDNDGIACEHLPSTSANEGPSPMPWIIGSAMLVGGIALIILWRQRRSVPPARLPDTPMDTAPAYDLGVEIDLAALKARQDAAPDPTTPGQET